MDTQNLRGFEQDRKSGTISGSKESRINQHHLGFHPRLRLIGCMYKFQSYFVRNGKIDTKNVWDD